MPYYLFNMFLRGIGVRSWFTRFALMAIVFFWLRHQGIFGVERAIHLLMHSLL